MSGETADERWRPILGVEAILLSVISIMNDPNINSPANIDASVMYRDNRDAYNQKVRRLAQRAADYIWKVCAVPLLQPTERWNNLMMETTITNGRWSGPYKKCVVQSVCLHYYYLSQSDTDDDYVRSEFAA